MGRSGTSQAPMMVISYLMLPVPCSIPRDYIMLHTPILSVSFIIFFSQSSFRRVPGCVACQQMQQIGCVHEAACAVGKVLADGAVKIKICILTLVTFHVKYIGKFVCGTLLIYDLA
jgi:hypothetical protein